MRFVYDPFTDADGTFLTDHIGETGADWSSHPAMSGQGVIHSNRVYLSTIGVLYASGVPPSADYDVTWTQRIVSNAGTPGGLGRLSPTVLTFYMLRLTATTCQLYRSVNGSLTLLDDAPIASVEGADYTMRLSMRGSLIRGYVDGSLMCEATDTAITDAGRVGIRDAATASTTTGKHIDMMAADTPDTPRITTALKISASAPDNPTFSAASTSQSTPFEAGGPS